MADARPAELAICGLSIHTPQRKTYVIYRLARPPSHVYFAGIDVIKCNKQRLRSSPVAGCKLVENDLRYRTYSINAPIIGLKELPESNETSRYLHP